MEPIVIEGTPKTPTVSFDSEKGSVSTASVSDGDYPYETAVMHFDYHDGSMTIVEAYSTKAEAKDGHKRWEQLFKDDELPNPLVDCQNSHISQLYDAESLHAYRKI